MRFLYQEWGISPWQGNSNTIKDYYPNRIINFYSNDGTHVIIPGDVITENATTYNYGGHAVIVLPSRERGWPLERDEINMPGSRMRPPPAAVHLR